MIEFLIDTSVWIAFFRGDPGVTPTIDRLLAEDRAAVCGAIYAELLSGAQNRAVLNRLKTLLRSLPWLPEPPDVWEHAAETRFLLARQGFQAYLIDLIIALTAAEAGATLLTRDRDFEAIRGVVPLNVRFS